MEQSRRTFIDEFKATVFGCPYEPGAPQNGVAKELGVTSSRVKTWRLEIEAAGPIAPRCAGSRRMRRKWIVCESKTGAWRPENEILQKALAFFASRAAKI